MNCIKSIRQTDATNNEAFISEPAEQTGKFVLYRDRKPHIVLINNIRVKLKIDKNQQSREQPFKHASKDRRRWKTEQNKQSQHVLSGKRSLRINNFQPFNMNQQRINNIISRRRQGSLEIQRKKLEFALKNQYPTFFGNAATEELLQKKSHPKFLNLGLINNSYIFLSRQQAKANISLNIHPIHRMQMKKAMMGSPSEKRDFFNFPKLDKNKSDLSYSKIH